MVEIELEQGDWITIRQILSLSLLTGKPATIINGKSFLDLNPQYQPVFSDFQKIFTSFNVGELSVCNSNIILAPFPLDYANYTLSTDNFSSAPEIALVFLPALLIKGFRSYLRISGVTHANISYPTNFLNETLFSYLEHLGFYCCISLKRFGFYGSGGGIIESKIYPYKKKNSTNIEFTRCMNTPVILGGRIYISKMSSDIAHWEKQILSKGLNMSDKILSIIEVLDSNGQGNIMQVFVKGDTVDFVFSVMAEVYNYEGKHIYTEDNIVKKTEELISHVKIFIKKRIVPEEIIRELILYLGLSGYDLKSITSKSKNMQATVHFTYKFL